MKASIFLRSYAADLRWVPYALRSIHKFVSGVDKVIISVPREDMAAFHTLNLTRELIVGSQVPTDLMQPYLGQQYDKLIADLYTPESDAIVYWDSDVIAIRPFSPTDLIIDGKPRCLMTPYSKLVDSAGVQITPWQKITETALGHPVQFEFMRCHPFLVPGRALEGFRDYIHSLHGVFLGAYIGKQPRNGFSEFNCLLGWAYYHKPELFSWWNTEEKGAPEPFVRQFWSWSGLTDAERVEMERVLE